VLDDGVRWSSATYRPLRSHRRRRLGRAWPGAYLEGHPRAVVLLRGGVPFAARALYRPVRDRAARSARLPRQRQAVGLSECRSNGRFQPTQLGWIEYGVRFKQASDALGKVRPGRNCQNPCNPGQSIVRNCTKANCSVRYNTRQVIAPDPLKYSAYSSLSAGEAIPAF
jgi:hypothetical protein